MVLTRLEMIPEQVDTPANNHQRVFLLFASKISSRTWGMLKPSNALFSRVIKSSTDESLSGAKKIARLPDLS